MIERFRNPKKSILSSPIASTSFIVYWVKNASSDPFCNGTRSNRFLSLITTPAAWVETCRGNPSKIEAVLNSNWFFSLNWTNSTKGFDVRYASGKVIFNWLGIAFDHRLASLCDKPKTRATSLNTILAAIVPNVAICAIWYCPYFALT